MAASTSLVMQAMGLCSNAHAGKTNAGEVRESVRAKATDSIWFCADRLKYLGPFSSATASDLIGEYSGDCGWDIAGLSSDPKMFAKNRKCWQLTMGCLSRSGSIYSYGRSKDSGHFQVKRSNSTRANYSNQRSQQSKGDKKIYLAPEKKPRAPEYSHKMTSTMSSTGTTSEALAVLRNRLQRGISVDSYMYIDVLRRCSKQKDLLTAKQVHEFIVESGMDKNPYVATALLNAYLKCGQFLDARRVFDELRQKDVVSCNMMIAGYAKHGSLDDARLVFQRMEKRDVVSWNAMIGGLAKHGCGHEAYRNFLQMAREGFKPNAITYMSILNASASVGALEWVKEVHAQASKAGLESDVRVGNAFVHMYAKSGSIDDALKVFNRMEKRDVVTWNTMIGGLAEHGCGHEAYRLFLKMREQGIEQGAITYTSILNASSSAGALEWVKEVHSYASKAGLESDLRVGNALVLMYVKSGSLEDARLVFGRMETRDIYTWTIMIGGLAENGCGHEAYRLFLKMRQDGFEPDAVTILSILNASASAAALEWVQEVHGHASKAGLESDLRVGNALIHMYAKSGSIDDARLVFDRMEKRDLVTWNTMIGGLAEHGCGREALELFRKMNSYGVKPDGTSFVAVLSACCHAALLDDGRRLFSAMTQDYGIEPDIVHFNCMVDLLGRAGNLQEAKIFVSDMPVEPNVVTWGALLGACRIYGNVEVGELSAKELLKLEPHNDSAFVLLSNIYAAAGMWEKRQLMRTMMEERGISKEPGRSWIEVDNKIHEFVVGDTSHPEAKAIYAELNKLTEELKAEGYIPDTQLVLQNLDEEDKELALCSHSERLAIAYGLMHIPRGKPIRVQKNLRVCSDCHTATKFISKVTGREVIARDTSRFHHFKDGVCSCGDYW
ncbi:unnamed protein product [Calypogeia fissa]